MAREFEVSWEGELGAEPERVWDAFTVRTAGWLWPIEYEPWVGGAERGVAGGTVTVWDPPRHFTTYAEQGEGRFNQLDCQLEARGEGTYLRFVQRAAIDEENYDQELDACRRHTAFYYHSLREYVKHFSGRDAAYFSVDGPESSAQGGFGVLRKALGVPEGVAVGDRVRLTPAGMAPIDGVVDYATGPFLGVRGADALYRFYGRDEWGWPVGVAHHLFAADADGPASEKVWREWINDVFTTEGQ